jgi:2-dehydro-3-deoxy-D-arabinonate dehydratase
LFISSLGTIEGFTIGNDMSSRSIEGENPLYLAQAKVYDRSSSLGPCLAVFPDSIPADTKIMLTITRNDDVVFSGQTDITQIIRPFEELASYLFRETSFEQGVMMMTGTGVIPGDEFTLKVGDEVSITIDHIGTLVNSVKHKS